MAFRHKDGFDKQTNFVAVLAKSYGSFEPFVLGYCGNNNSHIDVAPRIGSAFGV